MRTNGSVACWGSNGAGQGHPARRQLQLRQRRGQPHLRRQDGPKRRLLGLQRHTARPPRPPAASAPSAPGGCHTCGVKTDQSVACWGCNDYGQATPPAGNFSSVSAGAYHTCGVKTDQTVACWGHNVDGAATPPGGSFSSVSAGYYHTCGVKTDGKASSAGAQRLRQATPPGGTFSSVSGGYYYTCGVKTDQSVACWGNDSYGQATPPGGSFSSVSAGDYHTCGVKTDGSVACWGQNTQRGGHSARRRLGLCHPKRRHVDDRLRQRANALRSHDDHGDRPGGHRGRRRVDRRDLDHPAGRKRLRVPRPAGQHHRARCQRRQPAHDRLPDRRLGAALRYQPDQPADLQERHARSQLQRPRRSGLARSLRLGQGGARRRRRPDHRQDLDGQRLELRPTLHGQVGHQGLGRRPVQEPARHRHRRRPATSTSPTPPTTGSRSSTRPAPS